MANTPTEKAQKMSEPTQERMLKTRMMSPLINPFLEGKQIVTKTGKKLITRRQPYAQIPTGEIFHVDTIIDKKIIDEHQFVKIFAPAVAAMFELTKTAKDLFTRILGEYEKTPMSHGYAAWIDLCWFNNGLNGQDVNMSERTFQRGMRELIQKGFLYPKTRDSFWVNPAMFFKGDRVVFMTEYVIKRKQQEQNDKHPKTIEMQPTRIE